MSFHEDFSVRRNFAEISAKFGQVLPKHKPNLWSNPANSVQPQLGESETRLWQGVALS